MISELAAEESFQQETPGPGDTSTWASGRACHDLGTATSTGGWGRGGSGRSKCWCQIVKGPSSLGFKQRGPHDQVCIYKTFVMIV